MTATYENPIPTCPHCGLNHTGQCARVKAIEYYPDGKIKRVEYRDTQAQPIWEYRPYPWIYPRYPSTVTSTTTTGTTSDYGNYTPSVYSIQ